MFQNEHNIDTKCLQIFMTGHLYYESIYVALNLWFALVSLFNGISFFMGYSMPEPSSLKDSCSTIQLTARTVDKGFHTFPKGILNLHTLFFQLEIAIDLLQVTISFHNLVNVNSKLCTIFQKILNLYNSIFCDIFT